MNIVNTKIVQSMLAAGIIFSATASFGKVLGLEGASTSDPTDNSSASEAPSTPAPVQKPSSTPALAAKPSSQLTKDTKLVPANIDRFSKTLIAKFESQISEINANSTMSAEAKAAKIDSIRMSQQITAQGLEEVKAYTTQALLVSLSIGIEQPITSIAKLGPFEFAPELRGSLGLGAGFTREVSDGKLNFWPHIGVVLSAELEAEARFRRKVTEGQMDLPGTPGTQVIGVLNIVYPSGEESPKSNMWDLWGAYGGGSIEFALPAALIARQVTLEGGFYGRTNLRLIRVIVGMGNHLGGSTLQGGGVVLFPIDVTEYAKEKLGKK